jgi:hypothetical protein
MTQQTDKTSKNAGLDGFRAAGYCGLKHPTTHARCTREPGHTGDHVDYYTGRTSITDTEGTRWGK